MRFNKIFGIGLPRTGTTSLHLAFDELKISSIHSPFSFYERDDWSMLETYTAFSDTPIPMFYKKLDQLCPNSGFILTTRPVEDWLRSMEWLLNEGRVIWQFRAAHDAYNKQFFGASSFDRELCRARYFRFHEEVSKYFFGRKDLLILDLKAGYGYKELCMFLDLPTPPLEYPKSNEARRARFIRRCAYLAGGDKKFLGKILNRLDHYLQRMASWAKALWIFS